MSARFEDGYRVDQEAFREATYGGAVPAASFAGRSGQVLTCASLSKAYGAPGLRIGWLTVPDGRLREQLRLASSTPRSAAVSSTSSSPPGCCPRPVSCWCPGAS